MRARRCCNTRYEKCNNDGGEELHDYQQFAASTVFTTHQCHQNEVVMKCNHLSLDLVWVKTKSNGNNGKKFKDSRKNNRPDNIRMITPWGWRRDWWCCWWWCRCHCWWIGLSLQRTRVCFVKSKCWHDRQYRCQRSRSWCAKKENLTRLWQTLNLDENSYFEWGLAFNTTNDVVNNMTRSER